MPVQADTRKTTARKELAAAQLELLRALQGKPDAPAGFDRARIEAAADSLLKKRARQAANQWPRLACALGESFNELFASYARSKTVPSIGGALRDGREFARALQREGRFPDEGKIEALAFDLRYSVRRNKLLTHRFAFQATRLKKSRKLIIAFRFPLIGERWLIIPIKIL